MADQASTGEEESGDSDEILVSCRCESARTIATLLQCLRHSSDDSSSVSKRKAIQPVTVFVNAKSLSFHVYGKAKQIQSSVDMQTTFFSDYHVDLPEDENNTQAACGEFCVNLTTLLDCLYALGTSQLDATKVSFSFNLTKQIFKLELCSHQALTVAAIPGMLHDADDEASLALAYRSSPTAVRFILRSSVLQHVMAELNLVTGATAGTISIGKDKGMQLHVVGSFHQCRIIVPTTGSHVVSFELAEGTTKTHTREYPLSSLKESMMGLDIAEETCITMNSAGMVAIQHIVFDKTLSEDPCFVDYILCCRQDESDDDDDTTQSPQAEKDDAASKMTAASRAPTVSSRQQSLLFQTKSPHSAPLDHDSLSSCSSKRSRIVSNSKPEPPSDTRLFAPTTRRTRKVARRRRRQVLNDDSDSSKNLLDDSDSDSSPSPPPTRRRRDEECSSPELVYGKQT